MAKESEMENKSHEKSVQRKKRKRRKLKRCVYLSISLCFSLRPTWHLRMSARNIATAYSLKNRYLHIDPKHAAKPTYFLILHIRHANRDYLLFSFIFLFFQLRIRWRSNITHCLAWFCPNQTHFPFKSRSKLLRLRSASLSQSHNMRISFSFSNHRRPIIEKCKVFCKLL